MIFEYFMANYFWYSSVDLLIPCDQTGSDIRPHWPFCLHRLQLWLPYFDSDFFWHFNSPFRCYFGIGDNIDKQGNRWEAREAPIGPGSFADRAGRNPVELGSRRTTGTSRAEAASVQVIMASA